MEQSRDEPLWATLTSGEGGSDQLPPGGSAKEVSSRRLIRWCASTVVVLCLVPLLGWLTRDPDLAGFGHGRIAMAPSTSVVGLLIAVALLWTPRVAAVLALLAGAVSVVLLGQWALGTGDLERWFVDAMPFQGTILSGRMSPLTAAGLATLAMALAGLVPFGSRPGWGTRIAAVGAWAAGFLGFIVLVGYVHSTPFFYEGKVIPVSLPTALVMMLLGAGVAASAGPEPWPNCLFHGGSVRSRLMRTLVPYLVTVVLIVGGVESLISRFAQINPGMAHFIAVVVFTAFGVSIIFRVSTRLDAVVTRAQGALREEEERLRQVKQAETTALLVQGLAHEIRNPLFAISSNAQVLQKKVIPDSELAPFLQNILQHVKRLTLLMKDVVELGRPADPADFFMVDLREVVQIAAAQAPEAVPHGSARLRLLLPPESVVARIMQEEMTRVLVHLLANAMEHSPSGGEVHLSLSSEGGRAVISVRDEGTGLSAKILEHLFSPFVTDRAGQTGLGLALAKHFIDQQGGTLTAANNRSGPGACFTVTLLLPAEHGGRGSRPSS